MPDEHKAFILEYARFEIELSSLLLESLVTKDTRALVTFIKQNLGVLKDPDEGEPLDASWEVMIENKDPHQYGDFALTKFYQPQSDIGLGYDWEVLHNLLRQQLIEPSSILLGVPFGPMNNYFDPGKIGSYFQLPCLVQTNLKWLKSSIAQRPELTYQLTKAAKMFQLAALEKKGLYVTF